MKKLFTLLTLALMSIGSAWADELCSGTVNTNANNLDGYAATNCTMYWSGLQGGSNIITVSGVDYYKMGSNDAYVQLKLTSGNFVAGDVLTATVTSNGGESSKTVNIKVNTSATSTVQVNSNETKNIEYTLTAADIEDDGSIKIYRGTSSGSNLRVAVFSVSGTRSSETYTVTFNAGSNGTCGTASLTEASAMAGVILPSVTPNFGYIFMGWYDAASEGTKVGDAGDEYHPTSNLTLYAQYVTVSPNNTYYIADGDEIAAGTKLYFKDITIEYVTAGTFNTAAADDMINGLNSNYVASISSGSNGWSVKFKATENGCLSVGLIANKDKTFSISNVSSFDYVDKDGNTGTIASSSWTPDPKFYGIVSINVTAGTEYEFKVAGSKMSFYGFEFTPNATAVNVNQYEWATLVSASDLDFTDSDVKAYIVTGHSGSAITTTQVNKVAAGTPVLLNAAKGAYAIPASFAGAADATTGNLLQPGTGAAVSAEGGKTKYVLSTDGSTAVFKKINASAATVAAGKAYLEFAEVISAPALSFELNGDVTGINVIDNGQLTIDNYYNLAGQRVAQPTKGLYIVNGKKVIVR